MTSTLDSTQRSTLPLPGFNVEGGSVFTNFANTLNEGQLFLIRDLSVVHEKPDCGG